MDVAEDLHLLRPDDLPADSACGQSVRAVATSAPWLVHCWRVAWNWWTQTTAPAFQSSSASRRDVWIVLLPFSGIAALLMDLNRGLRLSGAWNVVGLDLGLCVVLAVATRLPCDSVSSDFTIAGIHTVHIFLRLLSEEAGALQLLTLFGMAAAGVHSSAVAVYLFASCVAAWCLSSPLKPELFLLCTYTLCVWSFVEHRVAQLFAEQELHRSYKPLFHMHGSWTPVSSVPSKMPSELPSVHSSRADMRAPNDWSPQSTLTDLFSRFQPAESVVPQRSFKRFISTEVLQPPQHDAPSEPPSFPAPSLACAEAPSEPALPISLPQPPEPPRQLEPLRAIKLGGFRNPALNTMFVEVREREFNINGRATYWPASGEFFLYYRAEDRVWSLAPAAASRQIRSGQPSQDVAMSPEGYDLLDRACTKAWKERSGIGWQVVAAGVEALGTVRGKEKLAFANASGRAK